MLKRWLDYLLGVPLIWLCALFVTRRFPVENPRKILLIKLAAMGDTILLVPVIHSFRDAHPDATIHWLVSDVNAAFAGSVRYVDEIILWNASLFRFFALIKRLRSEDYDAVIDLEQWARSTALLAYLSGASMRVGFLTPGQHKHKLFTETVTKSFRVHEIFDFYNLMAKLGPLQKQRGLEIWDSETGRTEIRNIVKDEAGEETQVRVLLHPGCGVDGFPREWPLSRYAALALWMQERFSVRIFLSGGPEEKRKTSELNRLIGGTAIDLGGDLSWEGVIALINRMDLIISGNTGIMHIAAAFQKKQVALHGPTNPLLWGPINPNAEVIQSSCPKCPCLQLGFEYHRRDQSCMEKIDLDLVKKAVSRLLGPLA